MRIIKLTRKVFVEVFCIQGLFNAIVLNVYKASTFSIYAKFSEKLAFLTP